VSTPRRLTYANIVSTLALVVAVGGGGAAVAAGLQKNSVGSPQIKNGQVKTADLAANAVTGKKVKESSLATVPSAKRGKNVLAAVISFDGSLVPALSHGAVSASKSGGAVEITFNRDVSGCAYVASPSYPGQASPAGGEVGVASGSEPTDVVVLTYDSSGAFTDASFTVVVVC
jgi:hypothetical protein